MEDLCQEFRSRDPREVTVTLMIPTGHGPWTEEEYLALGESNDRIELIDGDLRVTSSPTPWHQYVCRQLANLLEDGAAGRALHAHFAINLRLKPNRIVIPDLTVTSTIDYWDRVVDASVAKLVCEITSPSNVATDTVLKMHYYAEAGIPWYLLVDHKTAALRLYRLAGDRYVEHASAEAGEVLRLWEPVAVAIRPEDLLP